MQYQLAIKDKNVKPHLDIEQNIQSVQNGQITFTIRINNGDVVDLNVVEYVDPREYIPASRVVTQELTISSATYQRNT